MILLTGFEPFGGETTNPSWTARGGGVRHPAGGGPRRRRRWNCRVSLAQSVTVLEEALERYSPELVICVGQAGGRPRISLERVAINCDDARIPDNAGNRPVDEEVVAGGPAAYFSSLPVKAALAALRAAGIPAEVSQTAGTYVCNHIFYALMHSLNTDSAPRQRGAASSMSRMRPGRCPRAAVPRRCPSLMAEALAVVVRTALATTADIKLAAGTVH